jgi:hypothetical protein
MLCSMLCSWFSSFIWLYVNIINISLYFEELLNCKSDLYLFDLLMFVSALPGKFGVHFIVHPTNDISLPINHWYDFMVTIPTIHGSSSKLSQYVTIASALRYHSAYIYVSFQILFSPVFYSNSSKCIHQTSIYFYISQHKFSIQTFPFMEIQLILLHLYTNRILY